MTTTAQTISQRFEPGSPYTSELVHIVDACMEHVEYIERVCDAYDSVIYMFADRSRIIVQCDSMGGEYWGVL